MGAEKPKVIVISVDGAVHQTLRSLPHIEEGAQCVSINSALTGAADTISAMPNDIVVVDMNAGERQDLLALQTLMSRLPAGVKVVVLTGVFDEAVGRWFLQIKISDFLRKPFDGGEAAQVFGRLLGVSENTTHDARIVAFMPSAGGVGNTTLAVEASVQFAEAHAAAKVCLVDLDFQNDACASYLDIEPRLDLQALIGSGDAVDWHYLEAMGAKHASGLTLFAAPADPCGRLKLTPANILGLLDIVSSRFSHVVLDVPRTWFDWTSDVLRGSNDIFVVTDMTVPGLRYARRLAQKISELGSIEARPKVIVNRVEKQSIFGGGLRKQDAEQVLDGFYCGGIANNYPLVREAIDRGMPVSRVKQGNNVSADLRRIVFA